MLPLPADHGDEVQCVHGFMKMMHVCVRRGLVRASGRGHALLSPSHEMRMR